MSWLRRWFGGRQAKSTDFTVVPSLMGGRYQTINLKGSPTAALKSPTYAAAIGWIQRNITEPDLIAERLGPDGWEADTASPELPTITSPLRGDNGITRQTWTDRLIGLAFDLPTFGNGYLHKLRGDQTGAVIGYEWIPASLVTPQRVGQSATITGYQVSIRSGSALIQPQDMVHIRYGHDPDNLGLGRPVVASIGDALNQDAEGAAYMRRLLKGGSAGMIGTLDTDQPVEGDFEATGDAVRRKMREDGAFMLLKTPFKFHNLGYSPEQMALNVMLTHAQQTICAALGVPAQVLGVMAAEKTSTFANVQEANRQAASNCLGPLWDMIAEALTYDLNRDGFRVRFDWEGIQALQENEDALWARTVDAYARGVITRGDAKRLIGIEPGSADEEWYASFDRLPPVTGAAPKMMQPSQRRKSDVPASLA